MAHRPEMFGSTRGFPGMADNARILHSICRKIFFSGFFLWGGGNCPACADFSHSFVELCVCTFMLKHITSCCFSVSKEAESDELRMMSLVYKVTASVRHFMLLSYLSGQLPAERCRTDDLLPSIPVSCLPP